MDTCDACEYMWIYVDTCKNTLTYSCNLPIQLEAAKIIRARFFYVHGCVLTGKTALAETNIFFSFLNTFSLPGRGCGGGSGGGGGGGGGMQVRVLHVAGCTRGVTLRTDPPVKKHMCA